MKQLLLYFLSSIWSFIYIYGLVVPSYFLPKKLSEPVIKTLRNMGQNISSLTMDVHLNENTDINFAKDNNIDIVICNHTNMIDSLIVSSILKKYSINNFNFIYNSDTTLIPGLGLALYCSSDIKIHKKDWSDDKNLLSKQLEKISNSKDKQVIIIFPEGSIINEKLKQKSIQFAKDNGVEPLENLLIPRAKGLFHLINTLKKSNKLGKIWDTTIIIEDKKKYAIFGEIETPNTDEYDDFKRWLYNLWLQKDIVIKDYKLLNYDKIEHEYTPEFYILLLVVFLFSLELISSKYGRYYLLISFMIGYFIVIKGLLTHSS